MRLRTARRPSTTACRASATFPSRPPIRSGRSCSPIRTRPWTSASKPGIPLVPGDAEASGMPVAMLRFVLINKTGRPLHAAVCGTLPNFIGADGSGTTRDWKNDPDHLGPKKNRNEFRSTGGAARPLHVLGRRRSEARSLGHDRPGRRGRDAGHEPDVVGRRRMGDVAPRFLGRFLGRRRPRSPVRPRRRTCPSARSPSRSTSPRTAAPKRRSSWPGTSRTASPGRPRERRTTSSATTTRRAGPTPGPRPRTSPARAAGLEARTVEFVRAFAESTLPGRGQGGRPLQPQHAPDPDLLPDAGRPVLRLRGLEQHLRLLLGLVHPRLELRAGHGLPLRRPGPVHARDGVPRGDRRSGSDELPRPPADRPGPRVRQGRRRRPDGHDHEGLPRMEDVGRRRLARPALAGRQAGLVLRLDQGRLGRRPGRRHGGLPAQHHGRRVLRAEPADGDLVPGRAAGRRGDGQARRRQALRQALPRALRQGPGLDGRQPLERRILRAPGPAAEKRRRRRPEPAARHGRQGHHRAGLSAGRGLPRRPARRPVHGPRLRPRLPRRPGPRQDDARRAS